MRKITDLIDKLQWALVEGTTGRILEAHISRTMAEERLEVFRSCWGAEYELQPWRYAAAHAVGVFLTELKRTCQAAPDSDDVGIALQPTTGVLMRAPHAPPIPTMEMPPGAPEDMAYFTKQAQEMMHQFNPEAIADKTAAGMASRQLALQYMCLSLRDSEFGSASEEELERKAREACRVARIFTRISNEEFSLPDLTRTGPDERRRL